MGVMALGIASFAMGAVQTVMQYSAANAEYKQNKKNAEADWKNKQTELTRRRMQEQDALRQKTRAQDLEEAEARSEVQAAGAAAGVSGNSLDSLLADVGRRASWNRTTERENTDNIMQQLTVQSKGYNIQAQSRIDSVSKPSPLSLISGIASSGISAYTGYKKMTGGFAT